MSTYSFSFKHNYNSEQDQQVFSDLKEFLKNHDIETAILHLTKDARGYNLSFNFNNQRDLDLAIYCWELLQTGYGLEYLYDNFFKGENLLGKFYP